jgi:TP53 regulating kinase-like protein
MILGQGAEATITKTAQGVRKTREAKTYRHPDLDTRLRQFRTRREAKVLEKLATLAPQLFATDDVNMTIDMEFLDGKQLRDVLSTENAEELLTQAGVLVRTLHDAGVVHGDLTTSNIMHTSQGLRLVDFGLAEFADDVESQAVDLHLLKHAFEAKHPEIDAWPTFIASYSPTEELLARFEQVESRGRYKGKH